MLRETYPLFLASEPVQPNADLVVTMRDGEVSNVKGRVGSTV